MNEIATVAPPTMPPDVPTVAANLSPAALNIAPMLQAIERELHPDSGEYVGRTFVERSIAAFLKSRNRMLVLTGTPGVGKTALAVNLVQEHLAAPQPYLAHFCTLTDGDSPTQFCLKLADQLKAYLGDDYQPGGSVGRQLHIVQNVNVGQAGSDTRIVGVEIKELKLGDIHPREAFRALVREPLQSYQIKYGRPPGDTPLVIVIDALDRVWHWDGGQSTNIISMLADVQDLPDWVNFICTARPGPAVQALRAQAGVRVYDIAATGPDNLADIETFVRARFLGQLDASGHAALAAVLAESTFKSVEAFVAQIVAASQGNFSYIRRYIGAWRRALHPEPNTPTVDPASLLRFDGATLDAALDASYSAIYTQIRPAIEANQADADETVLATLAIAFEPLTIGMLAALAGWSGTTTDLADSLVRLVPVLEQDLNGAEPTYMLYHRGFADYVRRSLRLGGREQDLRAARALERADDLQLQAYSSRHRWEHLLRGLALSVNLRNEPIQQTGVEQTLDPQIDWRDGLRRVQEIAPDAVTRAQLLRLLAARALDPSQSDVQGSWSAAIRCLREAVTLLQRSRALIRLERRGGHFEEHGAPQELLELEQTLIALGDAYRVIAQRMDVGGRQFDDWVAERSGFYIIWDAVVRLPLTIYLLMVLATQGVREIHIPGALENLGRGQDWTIARLYVLSVSAYRRARALAQQRFDQDQEDDVVERLARTYMLMGAYEAAASTYENLLSRPAAISSQWRRAVWLLALGDVSLSRMRADRAADVLSEALLTFKGMDAPVLQARAVTSLATAHGLQAQAANVRKEGLRAIDLDDRMLVEASEALVAWRDVTHIQGDDGGSVDPTLAMSRIGHLLWRVSQHERLSDEQVRKAQQLRESIGGRIFPQRFEHPLLRLFRMTATVLLPAALLLGLMLLVQSPSSFLISTRTEPALQPPLIDLSFFPNNLINGGAATPNALTNGDVTQLISRAGWRQFAPDAPKLTPPSFDLVGLVLIGLLILAIYLVLYLFFGLMFILVASPSHYQLRRPGRLVLTDQALIWEGQPPLDVWRETLRWLAQELALLLGMARRRVLTAINASQATQDAANMAQRLLVPIESVERMVTLIRRERGRLLGDFSYSQIVAQAPALAPATQPIDTSLYIPGSIAFYDELCDELAHRLGSQRAHSFTVEIVQSVSGVIFLGTLLYTILLAWLSTRVPEFIQRPLPGIGYSLSDLYVVVAPGILLPLLWWFVAQPLAARVVRGRAGIAIGITALAAGAVTAALRFDSQTINLLHLKPDFFTPTLALGMLAAIMANAPPRPFRRIFVFGRGLIGTALALASLVCIVWVAYELCISIAWYDALVHGNLAIRRGLVSESCGEADTCDAFQEATRQYSAMICLRPGATEGYAFRGLAWIAQGSYSAARQDFYDALQAGHGTPPLTPEGCLPTVPEHASNAAIATLHANLGAASTLQARNQGDRETAEPLYQEALLNFVEALSLSEPSGPDNHAEQITAALPPPKPFTCFDLTSVLLGLTPEQSRNLSDQVSNRKDAPAQSVASVQFRQYIRPEQTNFLLQMADTCYSRGFDLARSDRVVLSNLSAEQNSAWLDLTAAVTQYTAVANSSSPDSESYIRAERGKAAAWLILGQTENLPAGAPRNRTYLLRALKTYRDLESIDHPDETIYAGQAWSTILLDAWNDARLPLAQAIQLNPSNPTYPALDGLLDWLDSTSFPIPSRTVASPEYAKAIQDAIAHYTHAIQLSDPPRSEAFATRSVLYYSLRNSPRILTYADEDYGYWMRQAIDDVNRALLLAEEEQRAAMDQVGFRYWRGRLQFSLALTWQRKLRGLHSWSELVPLYSQAVDDFSVATNDDTELRRQAEYLNLRLPWARFMLNNATHMQQAERAIQAGEYQIARHELELVAPLMTPEQKRSWDRLGEPRPEYSIAHGLTSLALGEPADFINLQTKQSGALASFEQAITDADRDEIIDPRYRSAFYVQLLLEFDTLLQKGLPAESQATANVIQAKLHEAAARAPKPEELIVQGR